MILKRKSLNLHSMAKNLKANQVEGCTVLRLMKRSGKVYVFQLLLVIGGTFVELGLLHNVTATLIIWSVLMGVWLRDWMLLLLASRTWPLQAQLLDWEKINVLLADTSQVTEVEPT